MTSYGYIIMIVVDSWMIWFHFDCIMQLTKSYHIAVNVCNHDDVIKWKHFPRYWPFVRGIHRSPVNSPHKGQWRGALMFSLIYAWIRGWVNNREADDLRRHQAHYDVITMTEKVLLLLVISLTAKQPLPEISNGGLWRATLIDFCHI